MAVSTASLQAAEIVDQSGRTVRLPEAIHRVVSLAPSITEIVYALGKGNLLVGATLYSTHPEAAKALPRVGSYVHLDLEKIVALRPDLCLGTRDGNPKETVERLEELGIPVYVIDSRSLVGIIEVVERLGDLLGGGSEGRELAGQMRQRLAAVKEKIDRTTKRPKVFFQIDAAPIITVGDHTFIDELIRLAGGVNVAAGPQAYPRYNWEEILVLAPEVAIVASMAGGFTPDELTAGWLKWPQIPAVKNNRVHVVDADLVDRPTARLLDGLEEFSRIIHPELNGNDHGQ
jgi:iron complex transport system substrate-binding protein